MSRGQSWSVYLVPQQAGSADHLAEQLVGDDRVDCAEAVVEQVDVGVVVTGSSEAHPLPLSPAQRRALQARPAGSGNNPDILEN